MLTVRVDPIFFLHHTQLDRLWHKWQQTNAISKVRWGGIAWDGSGGQARMDDLLNVSQLGPPIPAADVMSVSGDLLCYRYE